MSYVAVSDVWGGGGGAARRIGPTHTQMQQQPLPMQQPPIWSVQQPPPVFVAAPPPPEDVGAIVSAAVQDGMARALMAREARDSDCDKYGRHGDGHGGDDKTLFVALAVAGLVLLTAIAMTIISLKASVHRTTDMLMWMMAMRAMQPMHPMQQPVYYRAA